MFLSQYQTAVTYRREKIFSKSDSTKLQGIWMLCHRFNGFGGFSIANSQNKKKVGQVDFEINGFEREMLRRHWIFGILLDFDDMTHHVHNDKLSSRKPFWTNRYTRTIYGSRSLHFCNNIGYVLCLKNNMSSDNIGKYRDFRIPER